MRKLIASVVLAVGLVTLAQPVLACEGYWTCSDYDGWTVCYWIDG